MINYRIYFYDRQIRQQYPITVQKKNINDLCRWLNSHVMTYDIEVVSGYVLDKNQNFVDEIEFIPTEITCQFFITNYHDRLVAYNDFVNHGV
jgi:hypothetical protein